MSLDHRSFPHIFDNIFAFAPYESLLVLRRASRDLKNKADKRMLHHVAVFYSETSKHNLFFYDPEGKRLPCMMEWNNDGQKKHELDRHESEINDRGEQDDHAEGGARLLTSKELLQEVRVLDIHGDLSGNYILFLETLPIRVLRCIAHNGGVGSSDLDELVVHTVVLFVNWVCENNDYVGIRGDVPSDPTRVVVNIGRPNNAKCDWEVVDIPFVQAASEELIVIFQSHPCTDNQRPEHAQDFVNSDFFDDIVFSIPRLKVTFVDIHTVPTPFLGFEAVCSTGKQVDDGSTTGETRSVARFTNEVRVMYALWR